MIKLNFFISPGFSSLPAFYRLLNVNGEKLLNFLYKRPLRNYRVFTILKRNGTSRTIRAPRPLLKKIQRSLALELSSFYTPKPSTHGFHIDRSIKTNALPHTQKAYVFNIDLSDFFETIHFGRVKNLFMAAPINAPHNVAAVMAQICCYDGKLAQGAPTSPIISNMICRKLDSQLQALAKTKKCHYTRYADDITFSFTYSKRNIPQEIIEFSDDGIAFPGKELEKIIKSNGFNINPDKTRLQSKHQRQMVTGLVVNRFPNVRREFIRKTNSMIHVLKKHGAEAAEAKYLEILGKNKVEILNRQKQRTSKLPGDFYTKVVNGRINYIQMIKGKGDPIYRKLAYRFSEAIGKPNKDLLKNPYEILGDSVFVVENCIDDNGGTAFLLDGVGLVTNHHVVESITPLIARSSVTFKQEGSGKEFTANLLYSNKKNDIAIFYPGPEFQSIPNLESSRKCLVYSMDQVTILGYPKHVDGSKVFITHAKTTQLRRNISFDLWCVDTTLIEGNSGGPVFNPSLEVIGIASRGSKNNISTASLSGFIPLTELNSVLELPTFKAAKKFFRLINTPTTGTKFRKLSSTLTGKAPFSP